MVLKLVVTLFILLVLSAVFYPRMILKLFRQLGRSLGDASRAGSEILAGEEVENSPLARYEMRAGELVALKVLAEHPRVVDPELQTQVAEVGGRLAQHARRQAIPYRFVVVESREPNAFAVAGGSIFITKPLVDLCQGDMNCLAGVLGHEITHIDQRHALRNLAAAAAVKGGIRILTLGRGFILARVARAMREFFVQGYRQDQELEADLKGSHLARRAGFDPRGLLLLLERTEREQPEGEGPMAEVLSYFKSHPPVATRIARLREEIDAAR